MAKVLAMVTFKVFPPQMGGQKGVALFYKYLAKYLNVTLAAPPDNDAAYARTYGIIIKTLLYTNRQLYKNISRLNELKQLIQDASSDVLIAEHSYPALLGLWLRRKTGKPLIIHSHNIEALRFRQMGRRWWRTYLAYERWVHRQADFNFFISYIDQEYAVKNFGLDPRKCAVITYGVEQQALAAPVDKAALKRSLGFPENEIMLLFNGTLDYAPNVQAVQDLVHKINPLLSSHLQHYTIVITGARASSNLIRQLEQQPRVAYKGFVEDIDAYYRATDLFINPVANDSGVKTKVIEALAHNCTIVSFAGGATGIPPDTCEGKLLSVPDGDHEAFSHEVTLQLKKEQPNTPAAFYQYYNWNNIAQKAATHIHTVIHQHV